MRALALALFASITVALPAHAAKASISPEIRSGWLTAQECFDYEGKSALPVCLSHVLDTAAELDDSFRCGVMLSAWRQWVDSTVIYNIRHDDASAAQATSESVASFQVAADICLRAGADPHRLISALLTPSDQWLSFWNAFATLPADESK